MISQFSKENDLATLQDLYDFPKDVYPVGRLDSDSEGLLLLTNDKKLNHQLLNPKFHHEREYWVQIDGQITTEAILELEQGVSIKLDKDFYDTLPAKVQILENPIVPDRNPPIRYRANIPTSWISLVLKEGKNRQVRKMTAKVGFPTLRLIRVRTEKLNIFPLKVGDVRILSQKEVYQSLKIRV